VADGKLVFLDVDGTYADYGHVPSVHVAAVVAARAAGHLVFLCSGRPLSMLQRRLTAAGFDGFVASAGGYVVVGDEVLSDLRFPPDVARAVLALLDAHDAAYLLEAPESIYGRPGVDRRLETLLQQAMPQHEEAGPVDLFAALQMRDDLDRVSFAKVTYFDSADLAGAVRDAFGGRVGVLPSSIPGMGEHSGEIYVADVDKARGIARVVEHLGASRDDVVAFGDGLNDVEMLEYAGMGVAVEGAAPRVLDAADGVVPPPAHGGVAEGFLRLGLIGEAELRAARG
jgi:Cof subfamily protein (haloacid dehalogenase superfamily)